MDRLRCPRGKVIVTACSCMGSLAVHTPALLASNWVNPCIERSRRLLHSKRNNLAICTLVAMVSLTHLVNGCVH